jgi:hypothetical protein
VLALLKPLWLSSSAAALQILPLSFMARSRL